MPITVARIEETLKSNAGPLTVREIAADIGVPPHEVAEIIWGAPDIFAWQPGGRWTLTTPKVSRVPAVAAEHDDTRPAVLSPQQGIELTAIRMTGGTTLRVTSQPLDTAAFFTVRSEGSELRLVVNSSHELFASLPTPFQDAATSDFKALVETLLAAWALHEGEAHAAAQRGLEDTRLFWGRRVLELLDAP